MSEAEKFIGRYEQDILSRVYLPKAIKERCRLTACLKAEDDREVYLVKGMDDRKMILKIRAVGRPDSLEREYQILQELSHPQLPEPFYTWKRRERNTCCALISRGEAWKPW